MFAWGLYRLVELTALVLLGRELRHGLPQSLVWWGYGLVFLGFLGLGLARIAAALLARA